MDVIRSSTLESCVDGWLEAGLGFDGSAGHWLAGAMSVRGSVLGRAKGEVRRRPEECPLRQSLLLRSQRMNPERAQLLEREEGTQELRRRTDPHRCIDFHLFNQQSHLRSLQAMREGNGAYQDRHGRLKGGEVGHRTNVLRPFSERKGDNLDRTVSRDFWLGYVNIFIYSGKHSLQINIFNLCFSAEDLPLPRDCHRLPHPPISLHPPNSPCTSLRTTMSP